MYAITAHERVLIDQAIAAGAVRFIPQGVTGIDWRTGRHWPSVEDAIAAYMALVAEEERRRKATAQEAKRRARRSSPRNKKAATAKGGDAPRSDTSAKAARQAERRAFLRERQRQIDELRAEGLTFDAIAARMGYSKSCVWMWHSGG